MEINLNWIPFKDNGIFKSTGLTFKVIPSDFNENGIIFDGNPKKYCEELAYNKAKKVSNNYKDCIVIGADTIVELNGKLFPKPKNLNEANQFLKVLSGKSHRVFTGISLISNQKQSTFNECTTVTFNNLIDSEINFYTKNFNSLDKAGAYGIQDWSSVFVHKIHGCYFNVMGFPISKFYNELKKFSPKVVENLLVTKT